MFGVLDGLPENRNGGSNGSNAGCEKPQLRLDPCTGLHGDHAGLLIFQFVANNDHNDTQDVSAKNGEKSQSLPSLVELIDSLEDEGISNIPAEQTCLLNCTG